MSAINQSKINSFIVFIGGLLFSLYAVVSVMQGGFGKLTFYTAAILGLFWVIRAQSAWWMPIPLAAVSGAMLWVGFRVYTHEIALAMALAALVPAVILAPGAFNQKQRPPMPRAAWFLLLFILIHMVASWLIANMQGVGNKGSIIRTYMNALWPMVFFVAYYKYGTSRNLKTFIWVLYILLLLRCLVGIYSYFFPNLLYMTGSNFLFILSQYGEIELRGPSLMLFSIALALAVKKQRPAKTFFHGVIAAIALWLLLLGSSRAGFAMALITPLIIGLVQRRFVLMVAMTVMVGGVLATLNVNPHLLNGLPPQAQRALSGFVYTKNMDVYATIQGSNEWHAYLFKTGWERWTDSWLTFLVGNRVHPHDEYFYSQTADLYARADIAAKTTRYERSLWTVLATLGAAGGVLYVLIYITMLRGPLSELFRHPVITFNDAIYLIALIRFTQSVVFAPISGSFPTYELVWGALALGLFHDQQADAKKSRTEIAPA